MRGSHGRGDALPLVSDVDLAIIVREDGGGPAWQASVEVLKRLRRAAWLNPLIRDSWQLLAGDTEWHLFQRFWYLFQLHEWRNECGLQPSFVATPPIERLAMAASWNRQHMWTEIALRHALSPSGGSSYDAEHFAGAEKKALQHANRLTPCPAREEQEPHSTREILKRAASLLIRLDDSAAVISSRLNLPEMARPWCADSEEMCSSSVLQVISRYLHIPTNFSAVLLNSRGMLLVTQRRLSTSEMAGLLEPLSALSRTLRKPLFLYSPQTLSFAPIIDSVQVLHAQPSDPCAGRYEEPWLLCEQLFFEAIYLGAELRVLADREVRGPGPPLLTFKLARTLLYFVVGKIVRDRAAVLEQVGNLYPGVGRLLNEGVSTQRGWFLVNSILFREVVGALDRLATSGWLLSIE
jgi:hypothetical protein